MTQRLLFIVPDLAAGGAQPMNVLLAQQLRMRGWQVRLAVLFDRPDAASLPSIAGLSIGRLHGRRTTGKLRALFRLAALAREADLVIGGMEFAATNYGYLAARLAGRPFLSWTHIAFERHRYAAGFVDRKISHWVYHRCHDVVFPSTGARESLRIALGKKPAHASWHVIENFILPPPPVKVVPHERAYAAPVIIGVGRLVEQKAFDRLIRAHAALRQQGLRHHLVLLGDGPLRGQLVTLAARLGVADTVFMPGHVNDVADWLAHATVFALCSRYEGFSLVLLEALAMGVPAVAMACPSGPDEILQGGRIGRLVPADDEAAFTAALAEMLRDSELRAHFVRLGRQRAMDYTADRILPRWETLLQKIIEHRQTDAH